MSGVDSIVLRASNNENATPIVRIYARSMRGANSIAFGASDNEKCDPYRTEDNGFT